MKNCYTFSVEKYKSDDIDGIGRHNVRDLNDLSKTTNIDPNRTKNCVSFSCDDFKPTKRPKISDFKKRLNSILRRNNKKQLIKKSTNVFLVMTFSASPTYFFKALNEKNLLAWDNLKWENAEDRKKIAKVWQSLDHAALELWKKTIIDFVMNEEDFKDVGISSDLHLDEKTPHFEFSLVPKVGDKVNCKEFYTPARVNKWRARLDQVMAPLGLDRLRDEAPAATDDYEALQEVLDGVPPLPQPPKVKAPEKITDIYGKNIIGMSKQVTPTDKIIKNRDDREKALETELKFYKDFYSQNKAKVAAHDKLKFKLDTERKENKKMRGKIKKLTEDQVENLRSIDCNDVLQSLGFETKKEGNTTRVKTNEINLVVNSENKFTENKNSIYGGGAVDLLIKVFKYSFKEATDYLSTTFGSERTAKVVLANPKQTADTIKKHVEIVAKSLPTPKPNNLPKVKDYLIQQRGIDKDIVENLISQGLIYADGKNNCVFQNEEKTFSFSRGTYLAKKFVCCNGEMNFLKYDFGKNTNELYLFESAIDALSYRSLNPNANGLYVVLNGNALIHRVEELGIDNFTKVHCCFDNDEQGEKFCDKIKSQTVATIEIHKPKNKDFNEDLKNGKPNTPIIEPRNSEVATGIIGQTNPIAENSAKGNSDNRRRFPK